MDIYICEYIGIRGLLDKYQTYFFCENLVDFNEARLLEAILNLHKIPEFFQPVFSVLVGFS